MVTLPEEKSNIVLLLKIYLRVTILIHFYYCLSGFKKLLSKILQEEINALPRGVGRRNLMKPTRTMMSQVPEVLRNLYEASTRPGILPGVAGEFLSTHLRCFPKRFYVGG